MLIIGERINTSRKEIASAVEKKDAQFINLEAKKQKDAGAGFIDINCGANINTEIDDLKWVAAVVRSAVNLPLCIDSPDPKAIEAVLSVNKGEAFINSVTAEKQRLDAVLPLAKKHNCFIIGLAMTGKGVPATAEERLDAAAQIKDAVKKSGIDTDKLYIDAVAQSIAADQRQGMEFLKALELIKSSLKLKTIAGLSNVSFGLPKRAVLNSSFLAMAIGCGLDAAITDVTNPYIYSALRAARAITGDDQYCRDYIAAYRNGRLL